ncbi:hypothetical protein [Bremerella cremea]|uniref:hypothetical protein n=1 Tax=Bremerella cremea TaxID=1031537 RepID=UPI0031E8C7F7
MREVICHDCDVAMSKGFMPEHVTGLLQQQTRWYDGEPTARRMGTAIFSNQGVYLLTTYRCRDCGQLKSYADPEE